MRQEKPAIPLPGPWSCKIRSQSGSVYPNGTEGDWEPYPLGGIEVRDPNNHIVCDYVWDKYNRNQKIATFRLLAASWDLYRELAHLVRLMEPLEQAGTLNVPGLATLNGAREALRKAETS